MTYGKIIEIPKRKNIYTDVKYRLALTEFILENDFATSQWDVLGACIFFFFV